MDKPQELSFNVTLAEMTAIIDQANSHAVLASEPDKSYPPYDIGDQEWNSGQYSSMYGPAVFAQNLGERQTHPTQQDACGYFNLPVTSVEFWTTENLAELFDRALQAVAYELRAYDAGATFCGVLRFSNWLITANLGDSRAVLMTRNQEEQWRALAMSQVHNLANESERRRVHDEGCRIQFADAANQNWHEARIVSTPNSQQRNLTLALTRAFGNRRFTTGLSRRAEFSCFDMNSFTQNIQFATVLLHSDGFLCPVNQLSALFTELQAFSFVQWPEKLCQYSLNTRYSRDNTTAMLFPVYSPLKRQWIPRIEVSFVADGHGLMGHEVSAKISSLLYDNFVRLINLAEQYPDVWNVPKEDDVAESTPPTFPATQPENTQVASVDESHTAPSEQPVTDSDELLIGQMSMLPTTTRLLQIRSNSWTCSLTTTNTPAPTVPTMSAVMN